jgi:hypothetical protein
MAQKFGAARALAKPFHLNTLRSMVREVLADN